MVRRLVFLFLVLSGGLGVLGLGVPGEAHRVRAAGGGRPTRKMRFANSAVDEFVEVDDVTVPAVEAQTEAPTLVPTLAPAVTGELSIDGMSFEDAEANPGVFAAAVAKLAGVTANDVKVTVSNVNGTAVAEYSVTTASVDAADALVAMLKSELTKEAVAEELKEQAEDLGVDGFDSVEVKDVSAPAVDSQTRKPTPTPTRQPTPLPTPQPTPAYYY